MPDKMPEHNSDRMPEIMSEYISERMPTNAKQNAITGHNICQIENLIESQVERRKECQIECQNECQNICQKNILDRMSKNTCQIEFTECKNMCQSVCPIVF